MIMKSTVAVNSVEEANKNIEENTKKRTPPQKKQKDWSPYKYALTS